MMLTTSFSQCIKKLQDVPCRGEPSLQNALEVALSSLRHLPPHTSREILIIYAALTTCDPGEIIATLQVGSTQFAEGLRLNSENCFYSFYLKFLKDHYVI